MLTVLHCIVPHCAVLCRAALFGSLAVARRYPEGLLGPPWSALGATREALWASPRGLLELSRKAQEVLGYLLGGATGALGSPCQLPRGRHMENSK